MFDHPYLTQMVSTFEQEEVVRAAERRRILREHTDQIVPRPEGRVRRMLRRVFRPGGGVADAAAAAGKAEIARGALTQTASPCETTAVAAR